MEPALVLIVFGREERGAAHVADDLFEAGQVCAVEEKYGALTASAASEHKQIGDIDREGCGDARQEVHAHVHLAPFDLADVLRGIPGELRQTLLTEAARAPQAPDVPADTGASVGVL